MKLVVLIGNTAVGKMTVGQELTEITNLKLFHNHMMIEPVLQIFDKFDGQLVGKLRRTIFEHFAKSDLEGMIFTYMWAFDEPSDWKYLKSLTDIFEDEGAEVYYIELIAPQSVRLARNTSENRLKHKPSKRDLEFSEKLLKEDDKNYRCESYVGEVPFKNYLRIENTNLTEETVAKMIQKEFSL